MSRLDEPGWFDIYRTKPFPTLYGPLKTAVTADVLEAGLLYAIAILAFSFLLILPGLFLGKRLIFLVKVVVGLFILASIFLCNFGQEWEVGHVHTVTQYKAGVRQEITGDIEVKIGLRSVNITLKAGDDDYIVEFEKFNETINYNERFNWDEFGWPQGRYGFGPFAGLVSREYRAAQQKGLPYPILWIAEYFTPDGEGIRWGRYYRQAGYYTHIMMWLAFPLYILSLILVMMVRSYGGCFFALTGLSMITGNLIYGLVRNPTDLAFPFEDGVIRMKWGWCFWLCLFTGILNLVIALVILMMDCCAPDMLREFLNVDVAGEYDQFYISEEELTRYGISVPEGGNRAKATRPGEAPEPDALRLGYGRKTNKFQEKLAKGTMRFIPKDTWRHRGPTGFIQQTNDFYAPSPNDGIVAYSDRPGWGPGDSADNEGGRDNLAYRNDISLDDIAAENPDPEDMRGINVDPMSPDMDNYDNDKQYLERLKPETTPA